MIDNAYHMNMWQNVLIKLQDSGKLKIHLFFYLLKQVKISAKNWFRKNMNIFYILSFLLSLLVREKVDETWRRKKTTLRERKQNLNQELSKIVVSRTPVC